MSGFTRFTVTVEEYGNGWLVSIDDAGVNYARVQAGDLRTALEMTVPYMHASAIPDPFHDLLKGGTD